MKICSKFKRISLSVYFLVTLLTISAPQTSQQSSVTLSSLEQNDCHSLAYEELENIQPSTSDIGRSPANFVPDDDLIVVPMVIEKSAYDRFNEKHEDKFRVAKEKLQFWMAQEEYAQAYGLENTGAVQVPTQAEKEKFLRRNYLRFLSKDVERSTNGQLQDTIRRWSADDELDAIEAQEEHEKVLVYAKKKRGASDFKQEKSVKVGKKKIKFGFQPRLEIGMVKFDMKTPYFKAKAWLGVNGNQEINLERKIKGWGSKFRANYMIDESKILCAYDQRISGPWSFRFSHSKDVDGFSQFTNSGIEDNVAQLRFRMTF